MADGRFKTTSIHYFAGTFTFHHDFSFCIFDSFFYLLFWKGLLMLPSQLLYLLNRQTITWPPGIHLFAFALAISFTVVPTASVDTRTLDSSPSLKCTYLLLLGHGQHPITQTFSFSGRLFVQWFSFRSYHQHLFHLLLVNNVSTSCVTVAAIVLP